MRQTCPFKGCQGIDPQRKEACDHLRHETCVTRTASGGYRYVNRISTKRYGRRRNGGHGGSVRQGGYSGQEATLVKRVTTVCIRQGRHVEVRRLTGLIYRCLRGRRCTCTLRSSTNTSQRSTRCRADRRGCPYNVEPYNNVIVRGSNANRRQRCYRRYQTRDLLCNVTITSSGLCWCVWNRGRCRHSVWLGFKAFPRALRLSFRYRDMRGCRIGSKRRTRRGAYVFCHEQDRCIDEVATYKRSTHNDDNRTVVGDVGGQRTRRVREACTRNDRRDVCDPCPLNDYKGAKVRLQLCQTYDLYNRRLCETSNRQQRRNCNRRSCSRASCPLRGQTPRRCNVER